MPLQQTTFEKIVAKREKAHNVFDNNYTYFNRCFPKFWPDAFRFVECGKDLK